MLKYLYKNIHTYDLIHIHAWWNLVSVLCALICIIRKKSFVLSPRGTLSNYSFFNRTVSAKKYFHLLFGKLLLKKANFLLTSKKEETDILKLLGKNIKTAVIPNFVRLQKTVSDRHFLENQVLRAVFLSRIEEKKGLEFLFQALANTNFPLILTIAGDGDDKYLSKLKNLSVQLNVSNKIKWIGFVNNDQKFNLLSTNNLMILPSFDENFANVVIESLSVGTAVLITENVGLADFVQEHDLGWVCKQYPEDITLALNQIFHSFEKLQNIRNIAPNIINEYFDETNLVKKYISYYETVLNEPI